MSKHMKFKWLKRSKEKMLINFKKGYSSIIPFVYEGKEEIHKYMQYEASRTVCMGRATNPKKKK